ncbi:hypothetical protein [Halarsenatibacter silvermanii]|uniref:MerR HTH family regulatory protein n=1 Tax=Halarsenatibacter silvermanii TaxID=321763 RepID=A0A1G9R9F3_9FIRM|nr:hypothetical protein [Halarsenatibacter silvermanii]SDM19896.1 hypothetical protein SAMN04488692_1219 [Halarsenatibacter silvermanii]
MRLGKLTFAELNEWWAERDDTGQREYGNTHLRRYNLVDVIEELMDAGIILERFVDRAERDCNINREVEEKAIEGADRLIFVVSALIESVCDLDRSLPEELVSDELGGDRVWFKSKEGGQ